MKHLRIVIFSIFLASTMVTTPSHAVSFTSVSSFFQKIKNFFSGATKSDNVVGAKGTVDDLVHQTSPNKAQNTVAVPEANSAITPDSIDYPNLGQTLNSTRIVLDRCVSAHRSNLITWSDESLHTLCQRQLDECVREVKSRSAVGKTLNFGPQCVFTDGRWVPHSYEDSNLTRKGSHFPTR